MYNLTVTIFDISSGDNWKNVTLPADQPVEKWLRKLVKQLKIDAKPVDGSELNIQLRHKKSGKVLSDSDTLSAMGIEENDILEFITIPSSALEEDKTVSPSVANDNQQRFQSETPKYEPEPTFGFLEDLKE